MKIYKAILLFLWGFILSSSVGCGHSLIDKEETIPPKPTQTSMTEETVTTVNTPLGSNELINIIKTNGGCELPCILGLSSGDSYDNVVADTWLSRTVDTQQEYYRMKISEFGTYSNVFSEVDTPELMYSIGFSYETGDLNGEGSLDFLTFHAMAQELDYGEALYGNSEYIQLMSKYSSEYILTKYGEPTNIVMRILKFDGNDGYSAVDDVRIGYYYSEYMFYVEYQMEVPDTAESFSICPEQGFIFILSWRKSGELDETSFFNNEDIRNRLPRPLEDYVNIESISGTTVEDYYQKMTLEEGACFQMPGITEFSEE